MSANEFPDTLDAIPAQAVIPYGRPVYRSSGGFARLARSERQRIPCIGGDKYFCIDWSVEIWRPAAWAEPMGSVFNRDCVPDIRESCNSCTMR